MFLTQCRSHSRAMANWRTPSLWLLDTAQLCLVGTVPLGVADVPQVCSRFGMHLNPHWHYR